MSEITTSDAVRDLMAMDAEVVPARMIAPVLKMSESVLIHRVKSGQWNEDALGRVVVSGNRVKFFRKDFLQKCGFIDPDPEEVTIKQLLSDIRDELKRMNKLTLAGMDLRQRMSLELMNDDEKKTASAATPAE